MKRIKIIFVSAVLILISASICFAGGQQETKSGAVAKERAEFTVECNQNSTLPIEVNVVDFKYDVESVKSKGYKIGFAQTVMDHPYRIDMIKRAEAMCEELGVEMIMMDGEGNASIEVSNVESMIAMKVDAIIISTHAGVALTPALLQADQNNIPIILIDGGKPFDNWNYVTWMSTDDWQLGQLAAKMLAEETNGKGKVLELEGSSGSSCQQGRKEGFENILSEYPGLELVATQTANWLRLDALNVTSNILQAYPDLTAIYAHNDEMSLGAIEAIEKAGKVPGKDILVYSAGDYQANAFEAIKEGKLQLTQIYNNDGGYAVEAAVTYLEGGIDQIPLRINLGTEQATAETVDMRTAAY